MILSEESNNSHNGDRVDYILHTSFYEIYNELVFDLLAKDQSNGNTNGSNSDSHRKPSKKERKMAEKIRHDTAFKDGNLLSVELAQRRALQVRYDDANRGFAVQGLTSKQCSTKAQVSEESNLTMTV